MHATLIAVSDSFATAKAVGSSVRLFGDAKLFAKNKRAVCGDPHLGGVQSASHFARGRAKYVSRHGAACFQPPTEKPTAQRKPPPRRTHETFALREWLSFGGETHAAPGTFLIDVQYLLNPELWPSSSSNAELGAGSSFAIVDRPALEAALTNSGFLDLNFQPLPGTVPVVRILTPMERSGDSFALVQQLPDGEVTSSPLTWSGTLTDNSGEVPVSFECRTATYDPALPFRVMDLSTHELAPMNAENVGG